MSLNIGLKNLNLVKQMPAISNEEYLEAALYWTNEFDKFNNELATMLTGLHNVNLIKQVVAEEGYTPAIKKLIGDIKIDVSTEGIFAKIKDYIVKLWKAFWNFIKSIFGLGDNETEKLKKEVESLKQAATTSVSQLEELRDRINKMNNKNIEQGAELSRLKELAKTNKSAADEEYESMRKKLIDTIDDKIKLELKLKELENEYASIKEQRNDALNSNYKFRDAVREILSNSFYNINTIQNITNIVRDPNVLYKYKDFTHGESLDGKHIVFIVTTEDGRDLDLGPIETALPNGITIQQIANNKVTAWRMYRSLEEPLKALEAKSLAELSKNINSEEVKQIVTFVREMLQEVKEMIFQTKNSIKRFNGYTKFIKQEFKSNF